MGNLRSDTILIISFDISELRALMLLSLEKCICQKSRVKLTSMCNIWQSIESSTSLRNCFQPGCKTELFDLNITFLLVIISFSVLVILQFYHLPVSGLLCLCSPLHAEPFSAMLWTLAYCGWSATISQSRWKRLHSVISKRYINFKMPQNTPE